jgi:hypothetical protein
MQLSDAQRERVIATAVDLLRHRDRERLLRILKQRTDNLEEYPDEEERALDRVAYALARVIHDKLGE